MDPSIGQLFGTKTLETGDYKWRDDMTPGLRDAIAKRIDKWTTKTTEPPFRYDPKIESDMALWKVRRKAAMLWVKSDAATDFAKHVYKVYADIFSALIKDQGNNARRLPNYNMKQTCIMRPTPDHADQNQFVKVLESFYAKKRVREEGDLDERLQKLLTPLCPICECTTSDVVDCLSFVTKIFQRAVFNFWGVT